MDPVAVVAAGRLLVPERGLLGVVVDVFHVACGDGGRGRERGEGALGDFEMGSMFGLGWEWGCGSVFVIRSW